MASVDFEIICRQITNSIEKQMISRGYRVTNEIRNGVMTTLKGQGHGRIYKVPGTMHKHYTASAPGEVPANRTGAYRMSWRPATYVSGAGGGLTVVSQCQSHHRVNGYVLGDLLEGGTSKMAPRPHLKKIRDKVEPRAVRIYNEPYV